MEIFACLVKPTVAELEVSLAVMVPHEHTLLC